MSRSWAGGSTRAWRRIREFVLQRDQYVCRLRLDGCTGTATQAHHLYGKAAGDDPQFIVAACQRCNARVGDPRRPREIGPWRPRPQRRPRRFSRW